MTNKIKIRKSTRFAKAGDFVRQDGIIYVVEKVEKKLKKGFKKSVLMKHYSDAVLTTLMKDYGVKELNYVLRDILYSLGLSIRQKEFIMEFIKMNATPIKD